mmetsp:Transcript_13139/g.24606  ORF Transcript_13139/g.24606 Transcript_13139/m.24606 type:complete len:151 (+) Transcript_13139:2067-2519(+)
MSRSVQQEVGELKDKPYRPAEVGVQVYSRDPSTSFPCKRQATALPGYNYEPIKFARVFRRQLDQCFMCECGLAFPNKYYYGVHLVMVHKQFTSLRSNKAGIPLGQFSLEVALAERCDTLQGMSEVDYKLQDIEVLVEFIFGEDSEVMMKT